MRNPSSYLTAAEETLGMSSAQRGLGGMQRTAANPGPNMFDSGAASKVAVNNQPYNNARLQEQNIGQNITSALPQAQADAPRGPQVDQVAELVPEPPNDHAHVVFAQSL